MDSICGKFEFLPAIRRPFVYCGLLTAHISRAVCLSFVAATLSACAPSTLDVRQTSSLLDDLSASTQEDEGEGWTVKETRWRDQSEVRAWLKVEELTTNYGSSRMFFPNAPRNTLPFTVYGAGLPGGYSTYQVLEESSMTNGIGELDFIRLQNDDRECVYTLQYWGSTHRYQRREELLGYVKIQSWYCAEGINSEDFEAFVQGLIF